jgi:hypothetical protein
MYSVSMIRVWGIGWLVVVGDGLVPWVVKTSGEVKRG